MFHFHFNSNVVEKQAVLPKESGKKDIGALIANKWGSKVLNFIQRYGDPDGEDALVVATSHAFNIVVRPHQKYHLIVNLQRLNNVKRLSQFLADINRKLPDQGMFVCCLETNYLRRKRIYRKYPLLIGRVYYFFDYLLKRVAPSMSSTRWMNKVFSSGHSHAISYYEMLGRLIYGGFQIEQDEIAGGCHYIAARKKDVPPVAIKERYGLILKLQRVGQGGQPLNVYKLRTMVAFSEYVQDYVYRRNKLCGGGKFRNDKRVTILGGLLRALWIDELPMLANLIRGQIKLVGVRPLSPHYLALYDPEVIKRRISVKPGLIPPCYADLPADLKEIQASEMRYIERWEKAPFVTDVVYFFKALYNILLGGARSK
jgi:lipopolysaccharide/colanic/teichoic acid biosynthesis glycosyltransferase